MDAIVLAGGIPQPDDPLYVYSKGDAKALIDVAGKPMVQWVLDALGEATKVDSIIAVGLSPKSTLTSKKPMHYISNQGGMLDNIVAGINQAVELNDQTKYVMVVSADIPAIKPAMVDWMINTAMTTRDDMYYGVCPRIVMEKRFRGANRTYQKFKDMEVCGGDMNVVHVRLAGPQFRDTWERFIGSRKSPLRQATILGLGFAYRLRSGQLTLEEAAQTASERLRIKIRTPIWSRAEPAMDVDKPHQLLILRKHIIRQVRANDPVYQALLARRRRAKKRKLEQERLRRAQAAAKRRTAKRRLELARLRKSQAAAKSRAAKARAARRARPVSKHRPVKASRPPRGRKKTAARRRTTAKSRSRRK